MLAAGRTQARVLTWRHGARGPLRSRFVLLRVRVAGRRPRPDINGVIDQQWLIAQWPADAAEPVKYWLSNLPADLPAATLVRLAKARWRGDRTSVWCRGLGHLSSGAAPKFPSDVGCWRCSWGVVRIWPDLSWCADAGPGADLRQGLLGDRVAAPFTFLSMEPSVVGPADRTLGPIRRSPVSKPARPTMTAAADTGVAVFGVERPSTHRWVVSEEDGGVSPRAKQVEGPQAAAVVLLDLENSIGINPPPEMLDAHLRAVLELAAPVAECRAAYPQRLLSDSSRKVLKQHRVKTRWVKPGNNGADRALLELLELAQTAAEQGHRRFVVVSADSDLAPVADLGTLEVIARHRQPVGKRLKERAAVVHRLPQTVTSPHPPAPVPSPENSCAAPLPAPGNALGAARQDDDVDRRLSLPLAPGQAVAIGVGLWAAGVCFGAGVATGHHLARRLLRS